MADPPIPGMNEKLLQVAFIRQRSAPTRLSLRECCRSGNPARDRAPRYGNVSEDSIEIWKKCDPDSLICLKF